MQRRNWVLIRLAACGLFAACGGGGGMGSGVGMDGGGGGGSSGIPLSELPGKLADSLCAAYQNCYGPIFAVFLNGADCSAVTLQRIQNGSFPQLQGKIDQGKIRYDGSKAQACLDSLSVRTCATMLERDSPECLAALDGTVDIGGACDLDEDCKGKALCKSSSGTCPGQCTSLLVAGQACAQDSDCQDGLQCSTETKLCVLPAGNDQPCEYGSPPCGPGLLCLGKDDTNKKSGTCSSAAQAFSGVAGGACDPTLGQLCQVGLSCVADSYSVAAGTINWQCLATGSYAAGGACKPGLPDACTAGNYCKTGSTGLAVLSGTCAAIPGSGESCATGLTQCRPGAACVSGTCQNLAANGVSCTGDAMCYSGKCGTGGGCEANVPCK